ncbi:MAG: thioredoxin family protein [Sandaracinaceae bacterium]|nr:thioredoxin family protein [Sandaracinaceae bacterium]
MRGLWILALAIGLAACGTVEGDPVSVAKETAAPSAVPETARPYDESADAQAQIDAAVAASAADGKRVLLMFGANWCPWCRRLDWVFQNQPDVSRELAAGWRLVHVDVGPRGSSTNRAVALRYGDPLGNGLPCLVVLDDEGGVAHVQETGSLEDGDHHDPARVTAFLAAWRDGQG